MPNKRTTAGRLIDWDHTALRKLPKDQRYLVGISGGRDSVSLLHWLVRTGYGNLIVCHLNHRLRGRSSDADARFVQKLVDNYKKQGPGRGQRLATAVTNIDLAIGCVDVRGLAAKRKMSIETAARHARYEFFAGIVKQKKCHTIFLAHHADDLVETFLINLFRGAGASGLTGIRESSRHRVRGIDLEVVRPLLGVWRSDIDKYVRHHRLPFREDRSNKESGPLRNRIRLQVIPYLEKKVGKEIRQNIWRTAMILSEEETFFSGLVPEINANSTGLNVAPLRKLAVALQRRALRNWLRAGDVADVGFDLIERIRRLLDFTSGAARTNLPRDRHVRRRAGKLLLE